MSNEPAKSLYRKFGFGPSGDPAGLLPEVNEGALVMWAHDTDSDDYARRLAGIGRAALPHPPRRLIAAATGADMLMLGIETSCDETAASVSSNRSTVATASSPPS